MVTQVERARRLFTVEEYDRMAEARIFGPDDRVELVEGEIVEMSPIGDPHAASVTSLTRLLVLALGARAVVLAQNPVRLPPRSKPQPDLALLRPRSYFSLGPAAEDVLLVVEVADTSLGYDRTVKQRLYARAGVPEMWIVDTDGQAVELYRDPGPAGYRESRHVSRDGILRPLAFPDVAITVADLFA